MQVEAWRKTTEDDGGAVGLARLAVVAEGIPDEGLRKAFLEETWRGPGKDGLPEKLAEYFDTLLGRYRPFERGVKLITQENRFDRAMPLFRRFVRSTRENEKACEEAINEARGKGFSLLQLIQLTGAFPDWKAKEKSRIARTKSAKRKKKHQL